MIKSQDGQVFLELLTSIGEIYGKDLSKPSIAMWFDDLQEYSIEQIRAAFKSHRKDPKNGQFFPKPADIVKAIDGLPDEAATHAWQRVYRAIGRVGSWGSVEFDDPAIHQAIEVMGGWIKLCSMTIDEMHFKQREFEKLYMGAVKHKDPSAAKYLVGTLEIENAKQGLPVPPRVKFVSKKQSDNRLLGNDAKLIAMDEFTDV